jgi:hypothetical protein
VTTTETLSGTVIATTATGINVNGRWASVSKFKPVDLPAVGSTVRLALDPKGFINTLEVLDGPDNGSAAPLSGPSSRDRQIARLSVLKSAAAFAATRTDIKSADVLRIADSWLQWLNDDQS